MINHTAFIKDPFWGMVADMSYIHLGSSEMDVE